MYRTGKPDEDEDENNFFYNGFLLKGGKANQLLLKLRVNFFCFRRNKLINRPGVVGAVLQTPSSFINWFIFWLHQFYFRKICYLNNSNVSAPAPAPELFSYSWGLMSRAGQGLPPALHENLHPKQTIKGINFANKYFVAKCVMHLFSKTHWYWKINPYIPWCWPLYGYGSPWGDKSRSDRPDFTDI